MKIKALIVFAAFGLIGMGPSIEAQDPIKVTYIANEGFLINTGEHKILVDALFGGIEGNWCEQPGSDLIKKMVEGIPPFDNVDAILVSHHHQDHFNAKITIDFLNMNRGTKLICSSQAYRILRETEGFTNISMRVSCLSPKNARDSTFTIKNLKIRGMLTDHSEYIETDPETGESRNRHKDVENIMFLIESKGKNILHTGDGSYNDSESFEKYGLHGYDIDLAFLDRILMRPEGMKIVNEIIKPEKVVFMHISPGRLEYFQSVIRGIPSMIIFSEKMQTLSF